LATKKSVPRDRRTAQKESAERLRRALADDELKLHYQPIHELRSGRVVGAEALLRWNDATDEIGIDQLTSAAERGQEVFGLAEWATRTAAEEMRHWPDSDPPLRVNLNISSRHIQERNPIDFFRRVLDECELEACRFNLEITEKSFIHKPKKVVTLLEKLREMGFGLWLDDFGTGHSSIEHLKYFPVDGLKIPATYVDEMLDEDRRSGAIVRAMISVAKALEIAVVAEGVERKEQIDYLQKYDCDRVQGYFFSKPIGGPALTRYIKKINH
jgi:EAL domain-containing protein (putative c-di-GMP-specific phosphodiesterase class I)